MKKLAVILALTALVTVAFAQTQAPPPPPTPADIAQREVQHLTRALSLTAAQQEQALTIFTSAATSAAALHQSMKTAHDALTAAITGNNTGAIDQNAAAIGNLSGQLAQIQAKASAALYQVLTVDQQAQYAKMLARGPGRFGLGGFGPHRRGPQGGPQ